VQPDEVDGDGGLDEPLLDDAEVVRDEEAGVRFVLPAPYMQPVVWNTETGTLWRTERSACELWVAADRREPSTLPDAWTGLWQATVAALVDEGRLPPETGVGDLWDARFFFVDSKRQAGLAAEGRTSAGEPSGHQRAAFVCETMLFEVGGLVAGGKDGVLRRDVRRLCRSYVVLGADGDRLHLQRTRFRDQGLSLTTPSTYLFRPHTGKGFAPESATLMARTIVERVPPGIARVRGWLEVAPATLGDEPPTGYTADEKLAFLQGPGSTVSLGFESELDWGSLTVTESKGVVHAEATFRVAQDGRTWQGRVWWWFADGHRAALALAAPASSFEWQQYVFAAVADSVQGADR
jgi:hypothetical protein